MKKAKKSKPVRISLGISLLYALGGAGCGIDEPPSFDEMPRAFIHLTMENSIEDNLITSEDATLEDSEWKDDLIDQILAEFNDQTDQEYLPSGSEANGNLDQEQNYQVPTPGPTTQNDLAVGEQDLKACARLHGVPAEKIVIAGNQNQNTIRTNSVVAAKIAGNQTRLDLRIDSPTPANLRGICIFATGNQSSVQVTVENIILETAFLIGRGHKSQIRMQLVESYASFMLVDLAGNQPMAHVEGLPDKNCPEVTVNLRGNNPKFTCD